MYMILSVRLDLCHQIGVIVFMNYWVAFKRVLKILGILENRHEMKNEAILILNKDNSRYINMVYKYFECTRSWHIVVR